MEPLSLDAAVDATRSGDIWVFRGRTNADRAIRTLTNAPVNHVGMAITIDDLPPLMWHAELSKSLQCIWCGEHHPGVQLHDLRAAVTRWQRAYKQDAWLRQLSPDLNRTHEDALLRVIARMDGVSFPSLSRLAWRWLRGRTARAKALLGKRSAPDPMRPAVAYCAEVVALTFEEMGLLPEEYPANWYDPGKFWSGDHLPLADGWQLGAEIAIAR